jgi:glycosyltransferase involved in cell wall biosynthesis
MVVPNVRFTITVPTIGRATLRRTLESILANGVSRYDQILVISDGHYERAKEIISGFAGKMPLEFIEREHRGTPGHHQRNYAKALSRGTHLVFMDDDDCYTDEALHRMRGEVSENPDCITIFRMRGMPSRHNYGVLWKDREIRVGNIGTPMFAVPNIPEKLGHWSERYCGDFDFIFGTAAKFGADRVRWSETIIADIY